MCFFNTSTDAANFSFSSTFEGKKKAWRLKISLSLICYFPGGFGMLFQAYSTFENSLSLKTPSFSFSTM